MKNSWVYVLGLILFYSSSSIAGSCMATSFLPKGPGGGLQQAKTAACSDMDLQFCLSEAETECHMDSGEFTTSPGISGNGNGVRDGVRGFFGFCSVNYKCDLSVLDDKSTNQSSPEIYDEHP